MFAELERMIGEQAAAALRARFGGLTLYVPMPANRSIDERNAHIRAARTAGASIQQLMDKHELSRRHVWRILGAE